MVKLQLCNDVPIEFPFEPYAVQVDMMNSVLRGTLTGRNVLIESPTGTGKTMALLCASCAFVLTMRQRLRSSVGGAGVTTHADAKRVRIVYASRTHAQLAQVVREFKTCPYSKVLGMAVLGSREHLCVHSSVNSLPTSHAQNAACNALRSERGCRYFHGVSGFVAEEQLTAHQQNQQQQMVELADCHDNNSSSRNRSFSNGGGIDASSSSSSAVVGLHDIEELCGLGRTAGFCPYFYEREICTNADIVFLPYSYVFDASLAAQLPFSLDGCTLILDEAHNVPSYLASSRCLSLSPRDTGSAVQDCSRAFAQVESTLRAAAEGTGQPLDVPTAHALRADMDDFAALKLFLVKLEKEIQTHEVDASDECIKPGAYVHTFLAERCGLKSGEGWKIMSDVVTRAIARLNETGAPNVGLSKAFDFLTACFSVPLEELTTAQQTSPYRFVLYPYRPDAENSGGGGNRNQQQQQQQQKRVCIGFWCLDSSVGMQQVSDRVQSLILASGTLSPMPHFAAELGVPFPVTLQAGHVIGKEQLLSLVLRRGPGGVDLNSSYANRTNADYSVQLGLALVNFVRNVPDGVIVFFPSYAAMNSALDMWKNRSAAATTMTMGSGADRQRIATNADGSNASAQTVFGMLSELKPILVEPRDTSESNAVVKEFRRAVDEGRGKGAILLAVCRGKISEGLDFADKHGRAVIVTGLPFAHHGDLFVRLKKSYITSVAEHRPRVNGKLFTGDDWYKNEAMRAVNQALGRVIRHKDDYGAVVLADDRFAHHLSALSGWVRNGCLVCPEFRDAFVAMNKFFGKWKQHEEAAKCQRAGEGGGRGGSKTTQSGAGGGNAQQNNSTNAPADAAAAEQATLRIREQQQEQARKQRAKEAEEAEEDAKAARGGAASLLGKLTGASASSHHHHPSPSSSSSSMMSMSMIGGGAPELRVKSIFQKPSKFAQFVPPTNNPQAQPQRPDDTTGSSTNDQQKQQQQPQQQHQQPPSSTASGVSSGITSHDFLNRLKQLVDNDTYGRFKQKLTSLLVLCKTTNPKEQQQTSGEFAQNFSDEVRALHEIFFATPDGDLLARDFGLFIPEKLRPQYADLTRRRPRQE